MKDIKMRTMKKKIYSSALAMVMVLVGCSSDLDKVFYQESLSQPAVFAPLDSHYELDAQQSDRVAIDFLWSRPQVNYPASFTSDLQMDLADNQFVDAVTLASTKTDSTYAITVSDLNDVLMKLIAVHDLEVGAIPVSFRLVSTLSSDVAPLISNVVSTTITPYVSE